MSMWLSIKNEGFLIFHVFLFWNTVNRTYLRCTVKLQSLFSDKKFSLGVPAPLKQTVFCVLILQNGQPQNDGVLFILRVHFSFFYRAVFNWVSKVISELLWFCITSLSDWFKVLALLETKTNRGSRVHIFPRFVSATCKWTVRFVFPFQTTWCYSRKKLLSNVVFCTCICMNNLCKNKKKIPLGTSRGLKWENKTYKLKRFWLVYLIVSVLSDWPK